MYTVHSVQYDRVQGSSLLRLMYCAQCIQYKECWSYEDDTFSAIFVYFINGTVYCSLGTIYDTMYSTLVGTLVLGLELPKKREFSFLCNMYVLVPVENS